MTVSLSELLARVPESVKHRVLQTRNQARAVLRDAIRSECRLSMRNDSEEGGVAAQVPIELEEGYPIELGEILLPADLLQIQLLIKHRKSLIEAARGTSGLLELRGELEVLSGDPAWIGASPKSISATREWALDLLKRLEASDPVVHVLGVSEDVLGAYHYQVGVRDDFALNPARIVLYWCVIGLVAEWLDCTVEDLTVVVLAHELSHAYTQLGADIDGRRWPSSHFSRAELPLKEGLAQFYTARALARVQGRFPKALEAFRALLAYQPAPYHAHEYWQAQFSPEVIRQAMLEVRRSER